LLEQFVFSPLKQFVSPLEQIASPWNNLMPELEGSSARARGRRRARVGPIIRIG
jgi:hypothetical protein